MYPVEIERDIIYGTAYVGQLAGNLQARALRLDHYRPLGAPTPTPALVLAFGGAFHRGSKDNDVRPEDGPKNTSIASYCERFARRGYSCFSIDYRLTPEDPHPGHTPALGSEPIATSRIDVVRELLGLPPATPEMLRNAQEAAIDDMATAYRFVCGDADALGIDPTRVAVGGFSAGGRMGLMSAMAEQISPAAVVALSGLATPSVVERFLAGNRRKMPIFVASGEDDLDYIAAGVPTMIASLKASGHPHHWCLLRGQTHFYLAETSINSPRGNALTLEDAIADFLEHNV